MHDLFSRNRGFGLVEIMVGLVIGMITSLVVFQVFEVTERQKRTVTGGADAQTNGAYALYMMERDIRMAGFGLENDVAGQCGVGKLFSYYGGQTPPGPIVGLDAPASVMIEDGGAGSDQIHIVYYSNPADATINFPAQTNIDQAMPNPAAVFKVRSVDGCKPGELGLAIQEDGNCALFGITAVSKNTGPNNEQQIHHQTNNGAENNVNLYNPDTQTIKTWPSYGAKTTIRCGLKAPFVRNYRIENNGLVYEDNGEVGEKDAAGNYLSIELTPNTVALQAQYGISADDKTLDVNEWVDPTGIWAKDTLTKNNGYRIKALRVAVVAQSSEYEKPNPGEACSTTTSDMVDAWSSWADFSSVKTLPDWQCYRYKAFETVIPLRNVIWAGPKN